MKNKNLRIWIYLLLHALSVMAVIGFFRLIPDRKLASVFASLAFLFTSCGVLTFETWSNDSKLRNPWIMWPTGLFLVCFVIPILISRWYFWDLNFEEVRVFGIWPAKIWHQASNLGFLAMMAMTLGQALKKEKRP